MAGCQFIAIEVGDRDCKCKFSAVWMPFVHAERHTADLESSSCTSTKSSSVKALKTKLYSVFGTKQSKEKTHVSAETWKLRPSSVQYGSFLLTLRWIAATGIPCSIGISHASFIQFSVDVTTLTSVGGPGNVPVLKEMIWDWVILIGCSS